MGRRGSEGEGETEKERRRKREVGEEEGKKRDRVGGREGRKARGERKEDKGGEIKRWRKVAVEGEGKKEK